MGRDRNGMYPVYQGSSGGSAKCPESPDMPSGHVRSHSGDAVLKKPQKI